MKVKAKRIQNSFVDLIKNVSIIPEFNFIEKLSERFRK